jgi:hypothetical protein
MSKNLCAQFQKDAVCWFSLNVEKKINRRLSFTFMNQVAISQNFREIGSAYLDFGGVYKINNFISIGGNYRFIKLRDLDNNFNTLQRFYADLIGSKSMRKLNFQLRTRIQEQSYGLNLLDPYRPSKYFLRNKLTLRYTINSKYALHTSVEQFHRLNHINQTQFLRADVGVTYKFNLHHRIDFYYMNQISLNTANPKLFFIYGLSYGYRF